MGWNNMKKTIALVLALITSTMLLAGCAAGAPAQAQRQDDIVTISFDYEKQQGYASNQFAVWIENENGELVKTLFVTKFAGNGGFKKRPDAIPTWVSRSGAAQNGKADGISGATPKSGSLSYVWDLTDETGARVPNGTYTFYVEGTLRWKNRVLFTGEITIGSEAAMADALAEYTYTDSDEQAALTQEAPENAMILNVTAQYIPKQP